MIDWHISDAEMIWVIIILGAMALSLALSKDYIWAAIEVVLIEIGYKAWLNQ